MLALSAIYGATVNLTEIFEEVVHLVGEDKRLSISQEAYLFLSPAQEVTEVNMEEGTSRPVKHVISRVSIANSKHIGGHALPSQ